MIYVENDFYSNFSSAVKADDDVAIQKMLVDQFSSLIARRRGEVIQMLQKVGISVTKNPTNEELSNLIVSNLKKSRKLQAGLAYLVAKQNGILDVSEKSKRKSGANGEKEKETQADEKKVDWNQTSSTVTSIANTIGVLADSLQGSRASGFKTELQNQANTKAPNYSGQAYVQQEAQAKKKKKSRKWLWITLGVVAVAGIGYYGYKKGWFGGDKKALGGDVGGDVGGGVPS